MNEFRWVNQSQPQTLYGATILCYVDAVFGLLFGVITVSPILGLATILGLAAGGFGIANEKKWGYAVAVGAAVLQLGMLLVIFGFDVLGFPTILTLMFDGLLVGLLAPPHEPRLPAHLVPVAADASDGGRRTLPRRADRPAPAARDRRPTRRGGWRAPRFPTSTNGAASSRTSRCATRSATSRRSPRCATRSPRPAPRRRTATASPAASSRCSTTARLPHQVPADLRAELVELEAQVDGTFNAFRGRIDGERGRRQHDLRRSCARATTPPSAAQAWEASKQVGRRGRGHGCRSWRGCATAPPGTSAPATTSRWPSPTSELDETRLFATLDEVDRATDEPFTEWKAELDDGARRALRLPQSTSCGRGTTTIRSSRTRRPPARWTSTSGSSGSDLEALTRAHLRRARPRRPRRAGAQRPPPADGQEPARVLHRRGPRGRRPRAQQQRPSEYWAGTMLHEFGHALYDTQVDPDLPWLLRSMHPLTTEGVAMLFGRLVRDVEWLGAVAGRRRRRCSTSSAPSSPSARRASLLDVRPLGARDDPLRARPLRRPRSRPRRAAGGASSSASSWSGGPTERTAPDWAAKIHVALAPVYYQNYLYGELVASQLQATLRERAGGIVDRPEAGSHPRRRVLRARPRGALGRARRAGDRRAAHRAPTSPPSSGQV